MLGELLKIAGQCDGVRCDMAMLVLPDVFERTWGVRPAPFWPPATGARPGAGSRASASWPRSTGTWSGRMQQQGFDYAYDKRLYDRLREGHARPVRDHLRAGLDYQSRLARFLENHDEPRAASAFAPGRARGGRGHHVPLAGAALLPPGTVRGPEEADLAPPGPRAGRAGGSPAGPVLPPPSRRAPPACRAGGPVAPGRTPRPPGTATGPRTPSSPAPGAARATSAS